MNITFTTSFLHIYDTPYDHRNNEWRIERFKELASTGIQIALFISPEFESIMKELSIVYSRIRILRVLTIRETRFWKLWSAEKKDQLPINRTLEKDTIEYLCLMNSKIEFLGDTIRTNPFSSDYFAWIDFNITHVFKELKKSLEFIQFLGHCHYGGRFLTIPGCWPKKELTLDAICWRFCGGFFIGDRESQLDFERKVFERAEEISPTWEVNLWALIELEEKIAPFWFSADHNDSMVRNIPARNYSRVLNSRIEWREIQYPFIKHFQPSSISYCSYQGRDIVNVRMLNYHLSPNGLYYYPSGKAKIENINLCTHPCGPNISVGGFTKMREKGLGLKEIEAFSAGLEDVRIFQNARGKLRFIATSVGYSSDERNQMIIGDYDDVLFEFRNGRVIESPFGASCEKNWIPLPFGVDDEEYFIYSWHPYRIGKVVQGETRLAIVEEGVLSSPIFEKIRGSTIFFPWEGKYLGVVHFSENESPRHYFHMLVILDEKGRQPILFSQPFRFYEELGIEFCIGFCIKGDTYYFWVSHFDREPRLFILSKEQIKNLFIF